MGVAYHGEDCWTDLCKDVTEEEFIDMAQHSVVKTYMDDDDSEMDSLYLTRNIVFPMMMDQTTHLSFGKWMKITN